MAVGTLYFLLTESGIYQKMGHLHNRKPLIVNVL